MARSILQKICVEQLGFELRLRLRVFGFDVFLPRKRLIIWLNSACDILREPQWDQVAAWVYHLNIRNAICGLVANFPLATQIQRRSVSTRGEQQEHNEGSH
jgi:hypothetical protein